MECFKCSQEKPDSERSSKSNNQCKECYRKYANNYYHSNPEYRKNIARQAKELRKNLKIEVMSHYSQGKPICKCCGENIYEFLTIDHINNDGAKQRKEGIASKSFYRWLKNNNYPEDYQVLCMNCNFAKGLYGSCPHKTKTTSEEVVLSQAR